MRIGLLGCGAVVRYCHLPALRRLSSVVVAAADVDEDALRLVRARTAATTYRHIAEVLARSDIDAVVIALPSHLHAAVACASAAAGKDFYLEKPIATTAADAARVVDAVTRAGVRVAVGFNRRCHPLYEQARDILRSGRLGAVRTAQTTFCEPAPSGGLPVWKRSRATGGGVLLDLASHHVDLLRWFLDDEVSAVRATVQSEMSEADQAGVELIMGRGVVAQSLYSFRSGFADHLEFTCEGGTLRVDRHRARLSLRVRRGGYGLREVEVTPIPSVAAWWLRRLLRRAEDPSYFHAMRAFTEPHRASVAHLATLADGARSLHVVLAAEESARTNRAVSLGSW